MSLATPGAEPPLVAGNVYPKYDTRNPIARRLVAGYLVAFHELVDMSGTDEVLEVGCGEGFLSTALATKGYRVRGVDVSPAIIKVARASAAAAGLDVRFEVASVYDMDPDADLAGLVVCCEVLEHLEEPQRAFEILAKVANPYLLVSVPREPLWRVLNVMRGRYLTDLGNTPGHLQHWSQRQFLSTLERFTEVVAVRAPLPWTMALCRAR